MSESDAELPLCLPHNDAAHSRNSLTNGKKVHNIQAPSAADRACSMSSARASGLMAACLSKMSWILFPVVDDSTSCSMADACTGEGTTRSRQVIICRQLHAVGHCAPCSCTFTSQSYQCGPTCPLVVPLFPPLLLEMSS